SVSRPQLKSNLMGDRVMRNRSQGKKQEVEDQRRNVKLSKNKTPITACVPLCQILHGLLILLQLVEIVLFIVDSGCSKHMTGNLKLLINFVEKFLGTVKFGNDQIPNRKLIHNSILNGPYVRRMIDGPGDAERDVNTILLGLPEDIYAAVDSCETAQEIWLRVQQMMKGSDIGIQEKKAKNKHFPEKIASNLKFLNNLQPEWSRHVTIVHQTKDLHIADYTQLYDFLKYNQKEVDELKAKRLAKTQDPLALMENTINPYASPVPHQDVSPFNQNYLQQPMTNPKDITNPTTAMNMALSLMAKAFKLNYSTPTNNNQRISSNLRNRQIAQPGMNMGQDRQMQMIGGNGRNQFRQYAGQNAGNLNGYNAVQNVENQVAQHPRVQNVRNQNGLIDREVLVAETFHEQTDDELTEKEVKQIEDDDQAIKTKLMGLPEEIYAAVDSYKTPS
nr:integrase, catalytic region, zinc finger, CCHC-type, peptidase aspartic, catalytic [Tanacetum cinerariifolium]